jgi:hypothetical protein
MFFGAIASLTSFLNQAQPSSNARDLDRVRIPGAAPAFASAAIADAFGMATTFAFATTARGGAFDLAPSSELGSAATGG